MNPIQRSTRPVAIWLLVGVFMIIVQIILGGITRLTDSGLSITEWKPILGTIPPLNQQDWQTAFDHYKQIAQFKHLHSYFTLNDFKAIYFWEWLHRVWGRLIGVVFLIPFIIFLVQRRFSSDMIKPMIILFLLGGLQGLIGWIMVQSGLNNENLYVSHIRLAIHFIMALGLLVYTFWFALQLLVPVSQKTYYPALKQFTIILIVLLTVQLIYGAFMAGLRAAPFAPTWPTINGQYIPTRLGWYGGHPNAGSAIINDPITIHFIHRNLAYLIGILILVWTMLSFSKKVRPLLSRARWLPLVFVVLQITLGVMALFTSYKKQPQKWGEFEWMAQLHQLVAMCLLLSLVYVLFLTTRKKGSSYFI